MEIFFKILEGDFMVLEIWYIGLNKEICDVNVRILYIVYNRMGIVLKILFSIFRVILVYKFFR